MTRIAWFTAAALGALALEAPARAQSAEPPPPPVEIVTPAPAKKGLPIGVAYDGGTVFRSDDGSFELKLNGQMQARYEHISSPAANDARDDIDRFLIPRTRIVMAGYVWKNTQFKFEGALTDAGNARLRDFYVNQVFAAGLLHLRLGQFKRPFNRQEIVSDFGTEFVEKAITNTWAGVQGGRDLGIALNNGYDKSPDGVEWMVGLWNGTGDAARLPITCTTAMPPVCTAGTPSTTPADWQPQLVARVGFNMGGIKGYSEADLEGGPLRLAVAVAYRGINVFRDVALVTHDFEGDFMIKIAGLDVTGALFFHKVEEVDMQLGFHAQAGYMVLPKMIQVAARFAMVPLPPPIGDADQEYTQEIRGGVNWYFGHGHSYKWMNDFGVTKDTNDGARATVTFRSMAQLIF